MRAVGTLFCLMLALNVAFAQGSGIRSDPIAIPLESMPDVTSEWELLVMPGRNMEPTIQWKALLLFVPLRLAGRAPQVGEVVSYDVPNLRLAPDQDPTESKNRLTFIMRVVGVPGDKIEIQKGLLIRNGSPVSELYASLVDSPFGTRSFPEVEVPAESLFVMGDNRGNSNDSRLNGPIRLDRVRGIARYIGEVPERSNVSRGWRPLTPNPSFKRTPDGAA
jgi:signal peptidase I